MFIELDVRSGNLRSTTDQGSPEDHLVQFQDVAWPGVAAELLPGVPVKGGHRAAGVLRHFGHDVCYQQLCCLTIGCEDQPLADGGLSVEYSIAFSRERSASASETLAERSRLNEFMGRRRWPPETKRRT